MTQRSPINRFARAVSSALVRTAARPLSDDERRAHALVVAPHPDDETLGCGGTIIKKIKQGATIHVAYTTDGSASHRGLPAKELADRRVHEAVAACRELGIDRDHITFLNFPDGKLVEHEREASDRLLELMREVQPAQVFSPYRFDNHPDHLATARVVIEALRDYTPPCTLLEYPVWFWEHWPWMEVPPFIPNRRVRCLTRAMYSPLRALRDFRRFVDVSDVLDQKRAALDHHITQMTAVTEGWTTLVDISNGEFLERLLTDREVFAVYELGNPPG